MKHLNSTVPKTISTIILLWLFFGTSKVQAADFDIQTLIPTCRVGNNISLQISINSPDVAVNAVQGTLRFSANELSLIDLGTKDSLVQFWVQEPLKNNVAGLVSFEGAILNPGYLGKAGRILDLTFNCRQEGNTTVLFSSGSILANDGKGTNILDNLTSLNITILPKAAVTADATGVVAGTKITPKLILEPVARQTTDAIAAFAFKLQGAENPDYYEITLDKGTVEIWPLEKGLIYKTPPLDFGAHTLKVRAVYRNNYSLEASQEFTVDALALPIFKDLPAQITVNDPLSFEIITQYPLANVRLEFQPIKGGTPIVTVLTTDSLGYLKVNLSGLFKVDSYLVKAKVLLSDNSASPYTAPVVLQVNEIPLKRFQALVVLYLKITVTLGAIVIVLLSVIFYIVERIKRHNINYKKNLDQSFNSLDTEGKNIIELSDGVSGLSPTESQSLNRFQELLAKIKKVLYSTKL